MGTNTQDLNTQRFDEALKSGKPVLVDFWATWCPPCRAIAPTVDRVADRFADDAIVAKVDVDLNGELASRYGVSSIPTLILFEGGEPVERFVGIQSEQTLVDAIEGRLAAARS